MLDTLILILTLLLKAASLWFLAVALFALRKPKRYAVCAPRTRFPASLPRATRRLSSARSWRA